MSETSATPQLPLDFDQKPESLDSRSGSVSDGKVVQVRFGAWRQQSRPQDEVDSVLQDVLSNARKLNW